MQVLSICSQGEQYLPLDEQFRETLLHYSCILADLDGQEQQNVLEDMQKAFEAFLNDQGEVLFN